MKRKKEGEIKMVLFTIGEKLSEEDKKEIEAEYGIKFVRQDNMVIRRKEIIADDIDDMKDYEKSILLFIDKHPKSKKYQIAEDFKNLIDYEDISDLLNGWNDEGIVYMNYGYYCLTDYGKDLVKAIKYKLNMKGGK